MKQLIHAWIEQVFLFDSEDERSEYIKEQTRVAQSKKQAPVQIVHTVTSENGRCELRIRKPYNMNSMPNEL